jgi:hypothetical protein
MGSLIGYAGNVVLVKNLRKMIHKEEVFVGIKKISS